MTHTPGPWTLTPPAGQPGDDVELYARPVYGRPTPPFPDAPVLAVVVCEDDARLIAASPELLEAAAAVLASWDGLGGLTPAAEMDDARLAKTMRKYTDWGALRAAVKKARGTP
jgi:hypothetical protein